MAAGPTCRAGAGRHQSRADTAILGPTDHGLRFDDRHDTLFDQERVGVLVRTLQAFEQRRQRAVLYRVPARARDAGGGPLFDQNGRKGVGLEHVPIRHLGAPVEESDALAQVLELPGHLVGDRQHKARHQDAVFDLVIADEGQRVGTSADVLAQHFLRGCRQCQLPGFLHAQDPGITQPKELDHCVAARLLLAHQTRLVSQGAETSLGRCRQVQDDAVHLRDESLAHRARKRRGRGGWSLGRHRGSDRGPRVGIVGVGRALVLARRGLDQVFARDAQPHGNRRSHKDR